MQRVWYPQAEGHEANTEESKDSGQPAHRRDTGDDLGRCQDNADLERSRGILEIVVFVELLIAIFLFLQRAPH